MQIGVCIGNKVELLEKVKNAGFDYVELNCGQIAQSTFEELDALKAVGIKMLCANCFIGLSVVGDNRDENALREYVETMMSKAAYLGIKCTVFGSSKARRVPDNWTRDEAWVQVVSFLKDIVAPIADKYDITVAIEPLRQAECNCINTVAEGVEIAKRVNHPRIKVLADCIHMKAENEPFQSMENYKGYMFHAHTSRPFPENCDAARIFPSANDGFDQDQFILPVKNSGIEHCSIEATAFDFEKELEQAYNVMKNYR